MYDIQEAISEDNNMISVDTVFDIVNNRYKNILADVVVESMTPYYFPLKDNSTSETSELTPFG